MSKTRQLIRLDEDHILLLTSLTPEEAKHYLKREFLVEMDNRPYKGTIVGFRRRGEDLWFEAALSEPSAREMVAFLGEREAWVDR